MTATEAPVSRAEFAEFVDKNRRQHVALATALVEIRQAVDKALKVFHLGDEV